MCMQEFGIVRLSLLVVLVLFSVWGIAQHNATFPTGLNSALYSETPLIEMQSVAVMNSDRQTSNYKDPFVAFNHKCSFTPKNSGVWRIVGHEYKVWSLRLKSKGAKAIAIVLSGVKLNAGERVYIYNNHQVNGFSRNDIPASGVLPVSFLEGDEIAIEYHVPLNTPSGTLTIEKVSHAYVDVTSGNGISTHGRIANCYACIDGDSLQLAKRSVVKVITHRDDGTLFCSGTLINNTAKNAVPYILTAEHCITNEDDAARSVFIFNFDNICNTTPAIETFHLHGLGSVPPSHLLVWLL